jgi:hypothetical protein
MKSYICNKNEEWEEVYGASDGRCKMAVEEMGISDFHIADCGNSRSGLLGKVAYRRKEGGGGSMGASGGS